MGKSVYIAEKPSVAQEFAKALKEDFKRFDGYSESDNSIITWCVGHLVTMSYPDAYDPALKQWRYDTLPFIPKEFRYEIIPSVQKQFATVKGLLNRPDVERIYVCTDSGREGEYIYRLVDMMAGVPETRDKRRVWIDSQTEEEVLRGIREARPLSDYDNLSDAAFLRAKEDYLMGINFSRILTLKFRNDLKSFMNIEKTGAISVGRVMTCVLGMVVRREREIREFIKTPFYKVIAEMKIPGADIEGEFRAVSGSAYFNSPKLYRENGFKEKQDALFLIASLCGRDVSDIKLEPVSKNGSETGAAQSYSAMKTGDGLFGEIVEIEKKKENKNAPLLFNLAELQNECSRLFKISPDETLATTQELYEKKLVTYPRTDARVLSTAVAKEIARNIGGLKNYAPVASFAEEILSKGSYKGIEKTRYVNDKQITDHYAIIPTGQTSSVSGGLKPLALKVYELICRRFLSIFYPPAVFRRISIVTQIGQEKFFSGFKILMEEGWYKAAGKTRVAASDTKEGREEEEQSIGAGSLESFEKLKKGMKINISGFGIRTGETSPPKRYNSGSLILAMENAGQLIEDEELRAQIKGSGIGTSATRAEILSKLVRISYLRLNKKTQIITPTLHGEVVYEIVDLSIRQLLNPDLTASWEKGLTMVANGEITGDDYMVKLDSFVSKRTEAVKNMRNTAGLRERFERAKVFYKQ